MLKFTLTVSSAAKETAVGTSAIAAIAAAETAKIFFIIE
ncbi:MAG: hypothetical protein HDT42_08940 [Ruminococcaceae bacterium]|nr:hypothetical protein [Oscillospiraceae bacterium]